MAQKISLNKSELKRQNDRLKTYKKFLPSLDLKRKQIIAERNKQRKKNDVLREQVQEVNERLKTQYPMVSASGLSLEGLISVDNVKTGQQNVVGVYLPTLEAGEFSVKEFSELDTPHWFDTLTEDMKKAATLRFELKIAEKRLEMLEVALRKTTQRVNLFDKVLIPETKNNIKNIKIYMSDLERASVVRAKIAKAKNTARSEGK